MCEHDVKPSYSISSGSYFFGWLDIGQHFSRASVSYIIILTDKCNAEILNASPVLTFLLFTASQITNL